MPGSIQRKLKKPESSPSTNILGKLGSFETRLASSRSELRSAQALRYTVFCEEMSARTGLLDRLRKREQDIFDQQCDHLIVLDKDFPDNNGVIGTQRFFLGTSEAENVNFYSQQEFDISSLVSKHPSSVFMELGRSCISQSYRSKRTMELMWQGTWAYAVENNVNVMFGCASFDATDVLQIATELGFLSKCAGATSAWEVSANCSKAVDLRPLRKKVDDERRALKNLPPLIKGYLRLGAMFSNYAVPDPEFGTIDVLVVLPVERINPRYVNYYGEDASKHRA